MKRLHGLDSLRGIAALCVLFYHIAAWSTGSGSSNAYLAVDFFFMLSGYVMARTYETRLVEGLGAFRLFSLRYARLWPMAAFGVALGAPEIIWRIGLIPQIVTGLAANLILLPYFVGGIPFCFDGPIWSVFFELCVNLFHGFVIWRVRTRLLLVGVGMLVVIFIIHGIEHRAPLDIGFDVRSFAAGPRRILLTYLLGVYLYRQWKDRPPFRIPAVVTIASMPILFVGTFLTGFNPGFLDLVFAVLVCPILIAGGLAMETVPRVAVALGRISFPLYAVHVPIISACVAVGLPILLAVPLSLGLAAMIDSQLITVWWRRRAVVADRITT